MNPYRRFGLVSNSVSAAIIVGGLAVFGPAVFEAISTMAGEGPALWGALAASVTVLVVFWLAMTEAIFPSLFRLNSVRKMVLGKYYIEGTWLQSEKSANTQRMAVIDIQPDGKGFIFSGYALNEDLEIESNALIEFSKFEWPFMTYKYRNSLSDGGDGQREGVGEIQFEMNRESARRYNGYVQYVKNETRLKIEGAKLTKSREVRKLRSLEGREEIFGKYWDLFFNRGIKKANAARPALRPVEPVQSVDDEAATNTIIPRRRNSDWAGSEDAHAENATDAPQRRAADKRSDDDVADKRRVSNGANRPLR